MAPDGRYWDPALETMDPADREKVILTKLREQVAYCYKASAFYRERWDGAGFDPDALATLTDIRRIPLLKKLDLRAEQAAHPPFGRHLCVAPVGSGPDPRHVGHDGPADGLRHQ